VDPFEIGRIYDTITDQWQDPKNPLTGLTEHERAMQFVKTRDYGLDVGCGCNGRFVDLLTNYGFHVEGVDISEKMINLARQRHPKIAFYHEDICTWTLPRTYNFITAWDSIWHVPLNTQPAVLQKLCNGLTAGGVLIFTMGGGDEPGELNDSCMGPPMYYATLGSPKFW